MQPNGKVLDLIAKLREMRIDRGCTPAEAANAAAKVEELLQKHQLSIFDVEKHVLDEDIVDEERETKWKRLPEWVIVLAQAVAYPHLVQVMISPGPLFCGRRYGNVRVSFIGHESDVMVASYLFDVLSSSLLAMADNAALSASYYTLAEFRNSFIQGAAEEIHNRLRAEKEVIATTNSRALVAVKDRAIREYFARNFPNMETRSLRGAYDGKAWKKGMAAGRKVPLTKGVPETGRLALGWKG